MIERLRAVAVDSVIVVDLTRDDIGLPIARVVVPGLEGMDSSADYVPGTRAMAAMRGR
jgi:ribosomal protein S12 methylthiotransferase accessory factor